MIYLPIQYSLVNAYIIDLVIVIRRVPALEPYTTISHHNKTLK